MHELNFSFRDARLTVAEQLKRATDEKRLKRVARFLDESTFCTCDGTRIPTAVGGWPA